MVSFDPFPLIQPHIFVSSRGQTLSLSQVHTKQRKPALLNVL